MHSILMEAYIQDGAVFIDLQGFGTRGGFSRYKSHVRVHVSAHTGIGAGASGQSSSVLGLWPPTVSAAADAFPFFGLLLAALVGLPVGLLFESSRFSFFLVALSMFPMTLVSLPQRPLRGAAASSSSDHSRGAQQGQDRMCES